uniref:RPW8 domain-containing protein n=1 Tax=Kalanchoe fedtschenkoi TaxID=63787 RepID=A0A7N0T9N4_KALFE
MSGLVEGAVVGALVGKLVNEIIDATKTAGEFKPLLKRIESKIRLLRPEMEKMEELLQKLDRGQENKEFAALLVKGTTLVKKCSKVQSWNYCKRVKCSKLLSKLDESISSYCEINVALQTNRTATQTLVVAEDLSRRFDEYISTGRGNVNESELGLSVSCGLHRPPEYTVGLEMPLKEVKMKLLAGEVKVLVVFGPGGCGKTTLAKKLCEDSDIKDKYGRNIFFVTLSNVPNKMALNQLKSIYVDVDLKPKLVILDDVWLKSDHHIDDLSSGISNLKILVTSRFRLPRFQPQYELKLLNDEDAKKLFCHEVSFGNDSDNMPEDDDLVNKIVKCCNGFPLALSVVGKSLKGQHWTVWRTRAEEMSKGQAFPDSEEVLLNCLSTSLDDLDSVLKESFLDLGSFPEDARIPAAALVDVAVELYRQDEDGLYALRNLFQLHVRNLVNMLATREDASKVGGFCNEHFVTQHDLLRQLAIWVNNRLAPVEERARLFIDIAGNDVPVDFRTLEYTSSSARLVSITTEVDKLFMGRQMFWIKKLGVELANKVIVQLHMFGAFMEDKVASYMKCSLVAMEEEIGT